MLDLAIFIKDLQAPLVIVSQEHKHKANNNHHKSNICLIIIVIKDNHFKHKHK